MAQTLYAHMNLKKRKRVVRNQEAIVSGGD
jgi:hypothetical protein